MIKNKDLNKRSRKLKREKSTKSLEKQLKQVKDKKKQWQIRIHSLENL